MMWRSKKSTRLKFQIGLLLWKIWKIDDDDDDDDDDDWWWWWWWCGYQ
jgi:hypothetical protein